MLNNRPKINNIILLIVYNLFKILIIFNIHIMYYGLKDLLIAILCLTMIVTLNVICDMSNNKHIVINNYNSILLYY